MIQKVIPEEKITACLKAINKASKILITTHQRPDGDAVGSALGLYNFLISQDKQASVVLNDPPADNLMFLPGARQMTVFETDEQKATELLRSCDLMFVLDMNDPSRAGRIGPFISDSKARKVMVDHHVNPTGFADISISHPEVSSTSELIFRIICRIGCFPEMNRETGDCICAGMLTDTGGLAYNSNDPEIYVIMTELLKKGVNKDEIYARVISGSSVNRLKLKGFFLSSRIKFYEGRHAAISYLSYDDLIKHHFEVGDTEGFVNIPLAVDGIWFSAFAREIKHGVKISLRSKGDIDVNFISRELFGGGGHKHAAGGESREGLKEVIAKLEQAINDYVNKKEFEKAPAEDAEDGESDEEGNND